ncbi:MAG: alpha-N-arabinofuranosidase [Treponema sp.]|nr:alpha-N-arabinofuranosidase [Treponema sp.]
MNRIAININEAKTRISRHIYGNFSEHLGRCIYGGFWVGEDSPIPNTRGIRNDVVAALRKIKLPNLRWPGGCFADEYHWKDGVGPRAERPRMINTHWGGVTEDNSFGSHEFLDLCGQIGCEPYICGNVGSGTVQELSQWVEYMNFEGISPMADLRKKNGHEAPFNVRLWGIGNENWGCGGNMTAEYYADQYKRYATYARNYKEPIYKIGCGPNTDNYHWTEVMMDQVYRKNRNLIDGLSLHYYTVPGERPDRGSATVFNEVQWFMTMKKACLMDELVSKHSAIMDKYDPERHVGLAVDEWGTWYDVEPGTNPGFLYQQSTLRDALVAAIHLNIFNNHAERVRIANIAQTINVLQAVILTEGAKMLLTPTYHVFDMYKVHMDAVQLPLFLECDSYSAGRNSNAIPAISTSASIDEDDKIHVSICNIDPSREQKICLELRGAVPRSVTGQIITSPDMQDHNTFENGNKIQLKPFSDAVISRNTVTVTLPSKSALTLEIV